MYDSTDRDFLFRVVTLKNALLDSEKLIIHLMNIGGVKSFFHECCVCVENVCEFVTSTLRININFITIVYIYKVG